MSDETDRSSSEAKAGMAATRALAGTLSPEATLPAGLLGTSTPGTVGAPSAPTSVVGDLVKRSKKHEAQRPSRNEHDRDRENEEIEKAKGKGAGSNDASLADVGSMDQKKQVDRKAAGGENEPNTTLSPNTEGEEKIQGEGPMQVDTEHGAKEKMAKSAVGDKNDPPKEAKGAETVDEARRRLQEDANRKAQEQTEKQEAFKPVFGIGDDKGRMRHGGRDEIEQANREAVAAMKDILVCRVEGDMSVEQMTKFRELLMENESCECLKAIDMPELKGMGVDDVFSTTHGAGCNMRLKDTVVNNELMGSVILKRNDQGHGDSLAVWKMRAKIKAGVGGHVEVKWHEQQLKGLRGRPLNALWGFEEQLSQHPMKDRPAHITQFLIDELIEQFDDSTLAAAPIQVKARVVGQTMNRNGESASVWGSTLKHADFELANRIKDEFDFDKLGKRIGLTVEGEISDKADKIELASFDECTDRKVKGGKDTKGNHGKTLMTFGVKGGC